MTSFILLNIYGRSGILVLFLALQLTSFTVLAVAITQTRRYRTWLGASIFLLFSFFFLLVLTTALYGQKMGQEVHPFIWFFAELPAVFYLLFLFFGAIIALVMIYEEEEYQKGTINRSAIKESADNLPAGLCFVAHTGLIMLANRSMDNICYSITGNYLQDAAGFWETLTSGELQPGVERLLGADNPIIRLADGHTWSFIHRTIQVNRRPVTQITAIDTTDLDILRIRLQEGIEDLTKMNARLRKYSENIVDVTAKEERLATKIYLHNELGHALLSTRHILSKGEDAEEVQAILDLWKRNVAVLRTGAEGKTVTMLEQLVDAAAKVGISLQIDGSLPKDDEDIQKLIIIAGSEALNNAVRHAIATELYLTLVETDTSYRALFTNNGKVPDKLIIEGGGLSALRTKVERYGGIIEISSQPVFQMAVTLPKKEME